MELTHSLEDYIEAIWLISQEKKVVRVKDIMEFFGYKVSSVNRALKNLAKRELINYEKYGYIEITDKGIEVAKKINKKHRLLYKFFVEFLGIADDISAKDACNIEHYLSDETFERFCEFVEFINSDHCKKCLKEWKEHIKSTRSCEMRLSELEKGKKAIIKRISANESMKQKFYSMGLVPGEVITVEKVAPLGDPVDFVLKGYHLSLRKVEADMIFVEEIKEKNDKD